jgi:benzoyl-CoA reductase/2-hydroxyglutaryl-CoA dehydratase subunit BcrC/BadD/HgdB
MAREFAMLKEGVGSVVDQYLEYTYPYDIFYRCTRLRAELERRSAEGVIHYVQCFCHRGVQDRVLRDMLGVPVLTLECDRPGPLDPSARTRLEAFVEVVRERRADGRMRRGRR